MKTRFASPTPRPRALGPLAAAARARPRVGPAPHLLAQGLPPAHQPLPEPLRLLLLPPLPGDPGAWTMSPGRGGPWRSDRARARGVRGGALLPGRQARDGVLVPGDSSGLRAREHASTTSSTRGERRARARPPAAHERRPPHRRGHAPAQGGQRQPRADAREREPAPLPARGCRTARAPDKRPARRIKMIDGGRAPRIPFTTGILVGIGETRRERVESLLAIRRSTASTATSRRSSCRTSGARAGHRRWPGAPEPSATDLAHTVAMARLVLDDEVSVQAPPNLSDATTRRSSSAPASTTSAASRPVSPDYINPRHPWPHIDALAAACARARLRARGPRSPSTTRWIDRPGFLVARAAPTRPRGRARSAGGRPSRTSPRTARGDGASRAAIRGRLARRRRGRMRASSSGASKGGSSTSSDAVALCGVEGRRPRRAPRRRRRAPPRAGRRRGRLRRQPQHQLHQRVREGVHASARSPATTAPRRATSSIGTRSCAAPSRRAISAPPRSASRPGSRRASTGGSTSTSAAP